MRIMIVTDAWFPQTNGVVRTLSHTSEWLRRFGHDVCMLTPQDFRSFACPTYPEIKLSLLPGRLAARKIAEFAPHALHIATEGPLGLAVRRHCLRHRLKFTTSYHTRLPQYLRARFPVPLELSYRLLRLFHRAAVRCMVSTETLRIELKSRGFNNLAIWPRGVDTEVFKPYAKSFLPYPRPIAGYVGRIAIEKNIEAFLDMPWQGSKIVIGDGPERSRLEVAYPDAIFCGFKFGADLAQHLAAVDVMVFPSLTDTYGLVNLEAMACGVPVAAYPVSGPIDIVEDGLTGALDSDLGVAAQRALTIDGAVCRSRASRRSWEASSREFESNLVLCDSSKTQVALPLCAGGGMS